MRRGDLYRVRHPGGDPKRSRVFVVVSRQRLVESRFPTVVCAPVYARGEGLSSQVRIGVAEGLKHESWIMCDNLTSLPKVHLTQYIGSLGAETMSQLETSLKAALGLG